MAPIREHPRNECPEDQTSACAILHAKTGDHDDAHEPRGGGAQGGSSGDSAPKDSHVRKPFTLEPPKRGRHGLKCVSRHLLGQTEAWRLRSSKAIDRDSGSPSGFGLR